MFRHKTTLNTWNKSLHAIDLPKSQYNYSGFSFENLSQSI